MRQSFKHIDALERHLIKQHVSNGRSYRSIAVEMGRRASTISREVALNRGDLTGSEAFGARGAARCRRRRGLVKLREGSLLRNDTIDTGLRGGFDCSGRFN